MTPTARHLLALLLLPALALPAAASASAQAVAPSGAAAKRTTTSACATKRPASVKLVRVRGKAAATMTWRAPRKGPKGMRYRVLRDGRDLGIRKARRRTVAIVVGRRHRWTVQVLPRKGRHAGPCSARLTRTLAAQAPSTPAGAAVSAVSESGATLSWLQSKRGDGKLSGYRVTRDGQVVRQTPKLSMAVALTPGQTHVLRVSAVDTRGRRSAQSEPVTITPGHEPPAAPAGLGVTGVTDATVGLAWQPGAGAVAYRVARDGAPLFQTAATGATATNLAAATGYAFAVAAVDAQGYLSAPSASVSARTADPPPSTGSVHAFLLATTDRSFEALQAHYRQVGVLYPTYFDCTTGGAITGADDPLVTRWAQLRRIKVLPRFNCQNPATLRAILTNPAVREATLTRLAALVDAHGYDGINIDFESGAPADRDALTSFVSDLASAMHTRGKRITVEVSAKSSAAQTGRAAFYDYPALGASADWVFVMNWGKHWTTSTPGAMDDLPWAKGIADYAASMPGKSRYVLGFPLYGMDWAAGGGTGNPGVPLEYAGIRSLVAATGSTPLMDTVADSWTFSYTDGRGVAHEVWFGDVETFDTRIRLARDRGLGLGIWRLGDEDPRLWEHPQFG